MPTVYRLFCEHCLRGPKTPLTDLAPATHDTVELGTVLPATLPALRLDDGRLIPLTPPHEAATLAEHGLTLRGAKRAGRIMAASFLLCRTCGTLEAIAEPPAVSKSGPAMLTAFILAAASLRVGFGLSWPATVLAGLAAALGAGGLTAQLTDWRWQRHLSRSKDRRCRKCDRAGFVTLAQAAGKAWLCPHCRHRELWCRVAGVA